jgi:hypothetical protein
MITEPIGIFMSLYVTFVALIVLFFDMKCLANPERVFMVVILAESKQKETNAAHQGLPGRSPTDLRNLVTQYPPLFPTSFVPTKPYAMLRTRSPSVCLTV